jgi:hypothetical protein
VIRTDECAVKVTAPGTACGLARQPDSFTGPLAVCQQLFRTSWSHLQRAPATSRTQSCQPRMVRGVQYLLLAAHELMLRLSSRPSPGDTAQDLRAH